MNCDKWPTPAVKDQVGRRNSKKQGKEVPTAHFLVQRCLGYTQDSGDQERAKSAMTLTIDLTPAEEARLAAVAAQKGWNRAEAARRVLTANLPPMVSGRERETQLVQEYQALRDQAGDGTLSGAQAARLRQVEAELDFLEDQDPVEQEADRRLQETGDKLDEVLALLRGLPRKDADG